ncbi:MAG: CdaR family protein [Synergistaceae bacterium]|nr:CdaR family protein [Synergistaceae bacterium]
MFAKLKRFVSKWLDTLTLSFHPPVRIQKLTHVMLFLFSLLFSIAFWCFVSYNGEVRAIKTLSVPVRYVGLPPELEKKASVDTVRVWVSGRQKSLLSVSDSTLHAVVNLRGKTVGTYTKDINVTSSIENIKVSRVYPSQSEVTLYKLLKRVMPVNVNLAENVENKNISDVIITPSQIVVSGKEEDVKAISELNVLLDTEKLDDKGNITVPIIIKGTAGALVNNTDLVLSQKSVVAHVVFEDEIITKDVPLKFALAGHPQNQVVITGAVLLPASVKVKAKALFFKDVKEFNLGKIDVSNVRETTSIAIPFTVPQKLKNPSYKAEIYAPSEVKLNLICDEIVVKKFYENVPIKLIGLDASEWTLSSQSAVVSVEAVASTFSNLNGELPFEVFVDATDVVNKKITLPVSFKSKKSGVKLISIEPSIVTITQE